MGQLRMNLQETFNKDKYVVLRNFCDVSKIKGELKRLDTPENITNYADKKSSVEYDAVCLRNNFEVTMAQLEVREALQEIVNERIAPSYNWARVYKNGAGLAPHTDRPSCDISVSMHIYGDKPWAFGVTMDDGEERRLDLAPGDIVFYQGSNRVHWREGLYQGESYAQVFLHYVSVKFAEHAYDDKNQYVYGYQQAINNMIEAGVKNLNTMIK